MPGLSNPISLSNDAMERLCDIRDYLYNALGEWFTLNEVCSTIICQVQLNGMCDEKTS